MLYAAGVDTDELEDAEDLGGMICPDCGALYFWAGADFEAGCPDRHT